MAHLVCENDGAENHSEENYLCNDVGSVRDGTQHSHHQCERELIRRFYHHETESYQTLHLKTLRVCRQVYHEANPILWSTNTFSFTDAISLKEFMQRTHQVSLLRKLRLQMNWTWGTTLWNSIPDVNLIRSLTGLTSLRLQINHSMEARLYSELSEQANQLGVFQSELPGFMHRMATLPLREVEVFVGDDSPVQLTKVLWTVENRKEYAEGIREMLLHPKGANASK